MHGERRLDFQRFDVMGEKGEREVSFGPES